MFQESSLRKDPQNCLKQPEKCTGDYGVGQVRKQIWDNYPWMVFDKTKLMSDYAYGVRATAKVLAHYKRYYESKDDMWYGRFHSGTPTLKRGYVARIKVAKAKINNFLNHKLEIAQSEKVR
jgi:hypothetical protein